MRPHPLLALLPAAFALDPDPYDNTPRYCEKAHGWCESYPSWTAYFAVCEGNPGWFCDGGNQTGFLHCGPQTITDTEVPFTFEYSTPIAANWPDGICKQCRQPDGWCIEPGATDYRVCDNTPGYWCSDAAGNTGFAPCSGFLTQGMPWTWPSASCGRVGANGCGGMQGWLPPPLVSSVGVPYRCSQPEGWCVGGTNTFTHCEGVPGHFCVHPSGQQGFVACPTFPTPYQARWPYGICRGQSSCPILPNWCEAILSNYIEYAVCGGVPGHWCANVNRHEPDGSFVTCNGEEISYNTYGGHEVGIFGSNDPWVLGVPATLCTRSTYGEFKQFDFQLASACTTTADQPKDDGHILPPFGWCGDDFNQLRDTALTPMNSQRAVCGNPDTATNQAYPSVPGWWCQDATAQTGMRQCTLPHAWPALPNISWPHGECLCAPAPGWCSGAPGYKRTYRTCGGETGWWCEGGPPFPDNVSDCKTAGVYRVCVDRAYYGTCAWQPDPIPDYKWVCLLSKDAAGNLKPATPFGFSRVGP